MAKLVECVPNFSEGRRPEVIDAICAAITADDGVILLDREMDADHNRAVVTFVCSPDRAVDAAFRGYQKAAELIDMTTHKGEHPRMGACDVCPFIPISEMAVEDAVELAHRLGKRVGEELNIPVYLYEDAATSKKRKNLAQVRQGQYEGIRDSIETDPSRKPDYGPARMNLKAGATAIGVRFPLVAFNVYLGTNNKVIADKIADAVRSLKGGYRFVKALGFEIKERNQVQISMNLVNYTRTPIFRVFETIKSEAARYGVAVTSSEVIGLLPNDAIVDVADFYLRLENFSKNQILEEKLRQAGGGSSGGGGQQSFVDDVASSSPAPGGGSVSAFAGSLAAALAAMVCRLTVGKKAYAAVKEELSDVRDRADALRSELTALVVKDKEAFEAVMASFKVGGEQLEKATKHAAEVPLTVMKKSVAAMELALLVAQKGNKNSISDAGVAGLMGHAAIEGAGYNVRINLGSLKDTAIVEAMKAEVTQLRARGEQLAREIRATVEAAL
ncbi:MAG: glutamate formimidoyltransferase [candidate division Zixibacteria bacterium]|jgi:glutamate formiminotransferase/formiminotetrahydrofolate cyclodeaminase|nr:glutamate formimidoyltransferase [candidate division Zixibacteria bacterium]